jgi:hypothetical protein
MNKDEALKMAIVFIEEITNAAGKYPYVDKTQLVADSYQMASKLKEALEQPAQLKMNQTLECPSYLHGMQLKQPAQDTEAMAVAIALQEHIRQLKEQPAQEPVAWMYENHNIKKYQEHRDASLVLQYGYQETPLYPHSTPDSTPAHQWQKLTDDEILAIPVGSRLSTARAIEQALKEKNHG